MSKPADLEDDVITRTIEVYKDNLVNTVEVVDNFYQVWWNSYSYSFNSDVAPIYVDTPGGQLVNYVKLSCWKIPNDATMPLLNRSDSGFQYSPFGRHYGRFKAYKMPFLLDDYTWQPEATVSHLCHNNWCHNWQHHIVESLDVNKSRNGCPGGPHCHHRITCLIPGPYSQM